MLESNQIVKKPRKFNLYSQNDPVQSFFGVKQLDENESGIIEKIILDNVESNVSEDQVSKDIGMLKTISSEIKSINGQAVLLIGERIDKVRSLLKAYKTGTFVQWIDSTFDSRRTAYNMLSYYDMYQNLPISAKDPFQKIPHKAAYALASRNGDIEKKAGLVVELQNLKTNEMMLKIQEQFPSSSKLIESKDANEKMIESMRSTLKILFEKKDSFSEKNKNDLFEVISLLEKLVL